MMIHWYPRLLLWKADTGAENQHADSWFFLPLIRELPLNYQKELYAAISKETRSIFYRRIDGTVWICYHRIASLNIRRFLYRS
jgi:hypothetical protein